METGDQCPRDEELALWAQGTLSEERLVVLRAHTETCASCRTVIAELARTSGQRPKQKTLGRYELKEQLGAGGMGTVFAAWDPVVQRKVAVKVLHESGSGQRFLLERQVLAALEHPNITRLLDAGETDEGRPWFAMDHVEGEPIDLACDRQKLGARARLKVLLPVLSAVSYAHRVLVVHRDLKPGNILVDAQGEPRLMDFGIARLLEGAVGLTRTGVAPMTPAFASPEQVRREPAAVTSDVYSLGVTMYELLTGVSPYTSKEGDVEGLLRAIQTEDVKPPSEAIARASDAVIDRHGGSREALKRELQGDLDAILLMALRKEAGDRYGSVDELAADIRAAFEGLPTVARRGNASYQAARFVRRRKALVATTIALAVGLVATLWQARQAQQERDLARDRFEQVRSLAHSVIFDYHDGIAKLPGSTALRERLAKDASQYLAALSAQARDDIGLRRELSAAYLKLGDAQGDPYAASLGDTRTARESYLKGRELAESVLVDLPTDWEARRVIASSHEKMGAIFEVSGDLKEALASYDRARAIDVELTAERPDDLDHRLIAARDELGAAQVLLQLGPLELAGERLERTLAERRAVAEKRNDPYVRRGIAAALLSLSNLHSEQGQFSKAIAEAEEAEKIAQEIVDVDPDAVEARRALRQSWTILAMEHRMNADKPRALVIARKLVTFARTELKRDPENAVARRDLVVALSTLANILNAVKDAAEHSAALTESIEIESDLAKTDPENMELVRDLVFLITLRADAAIDREEWAEAAKFYQQVIDVAASVKQEAGTLTLEEHVALSYGGLAEAKLRLKQFDAAMKDEAIALAMIDTILARDPDLHRIRGMRGTELMHLGEIRVGVAVSLKGTPAAKEACAQARSFIAQGLQVLAELEDAGVAAGAALTEREYSANVMKACDP